MRLLKVRDAMVKICKNIDAKKLAPIYKPDPPA
jgi:hypothetical protein